MDIPSPHAYYLLVLAYYFLVQHYWRPGEADYNCKALVVQEKLDLAHLVVQEPVLGTQSLY